MFSGEIMRKYILISFIFLSLIISWCKQQITIKPETNTNIKTINKENVLIPLIQEKFTVEELWFLTTNELKDYLWFSSFFPRAINFDGDSDECMFSQKNIYPESTKSIWYSINFPQNNINFLISKTKIKQSEYENYFSWLINNINFYKIESWETFESQLKKIYLIDSWICLEEYNPIFIPYDKKYGPYLIKSWELYYTQWNIQYTWKTFSRYSNFGKNINSLFKNNKAKTYILWVIPKSIWGELDLSWCKTSNQPQNIFIRLANNPKQYIEFVWDFISDGYVCPNIAIDIKL